MSHRVVCILSAVAMASIVAMPTTASDAVRFTGKGDDRTAVFRTSGPWTLDWSIASDFPLLANFEMRLHDGASGEFMGTVIQLEGTGNGLKLFENGGEFRLSIVASNVAWELEIAEVTGEQAARIKRGAEDEPSLQDSSRRTMRQLPIDTFNSWRAIGNDTLLLFDDGGTGWRVTFAGTCPGLASASAVSFVTSSRGDMNAYDSILLDDGTRCHFDRVKPTFVD
ncbi:MAG TPA: DUF6491 family protein [Woeseiaceae bacterium]